MQLLNLAQMQQFRALNFLKNELVETDNFKLLQICFEPGQAVEPCVMSRNTAFYIIEGEGEVIEAGEAVAVSKGSLVLIDPNLERQIKAKSRMVVLAMQYC
jgi:quercetin dioxygenase-like cupin family protein